MDIKKIDDRLYIAAYGIPRVGNYEEIWNGIKNNKEVLSEAIKIEKDKFGEHDIVKGLAICELILMDYQNVDKEIYQNLINTIYSNKEIARIVIDGYANGGYSYLLMTLWNHNLKLTEEQKAFAVNEAMNKIGTTRDKKRDEEFSKKLDEMGITDDKTTYINIDGSINPIGQKAGSEYMNHMFSSLSDEQAHGTKPFDIRYQILFNPNWTVEEKKELVYDFFAGANYYEEYLDLWEWGIINDDANYKGNSMPLLDRCLLYDYTYEELLEFYQNKETADRIYNEINTCRLMHELRPTQIELEYANQKVKKQVLN